MNGYTWTQTALARNRLQASRLCNFELAIEGVQTRADDEERTDHTQIIGNVAPHDEAGDCRPERRGVAKRRHDRDGARAQRVDVEIIGEGHENAGPEEIQRFLNPEAAPLLPQSARH